MILDMILGQSLARRDTMEEWKWNTKIAAAALIPSGGSGVRE